MAVGTITIGTEAGGAPSASVFHEQFTMVGDGAYPTGGTLLFGATLAAAFPLRSFSAASIVKAEGRSTGYVREYIPSTGALKAYVRSTVPPPVVFLLSRVVGRGYRRRIAPIWSR